MNKKLAFYLLLLFSLIVHLNFYFDGIFNFFPETGLDLWGGMVEMIKRGRFDVHPYDIMGEAFFKDGKTIAYFGIMPSILRAIAFFFQWIFGIDKQIDFSAIAFLSSIFLIMFFSYKTFFLMKKDSNVKFKNPPLKICYLIPLIYSFCPPLILVTSNGSIYNEAILWGLVWSHGFVYIILRIFLLKDFSFKNFLLSGVFAGLALHSRATVGLAIYVNILFVAVYIILKLSSYKEKLSFKSVGCGVLILIMFGSLQLIINHQRWGNMLTIQDSRFHHHTSVSPTRYKAVSEHSRFSFDRINNNFSFYFIPKCDSLKCFPFFRPSVHKVDSRLLPSYDYHEDLTPSFTMLLGGVLFFMILGAIALIRGALKREVWCQFILLLSIAPLVLVFLYSTFQFVSLRYSADLLFYCFILACCALYFRPERGSTRNFLNSNIFIALFFIFSFGSSAKALVDEKIARGRVSNQNRYKKYQAMLWPFWYCENLFSTVLDPKFSVIENLEFIDDQAANESYAYDRKANTVLYREDFEWKLASGLNTDSVYGSSFKFKLKNLHQMALGKWPLFIGGAEDNPVFFFLNKNSRNEYFLEVKHFISNGLNSQPILYGKDSALVALNINYLTGKFEFCFEDACHSQHRVLSRINNNYFLENPYVFLYPSHSSISSKYIDTTEGLRSLENLGSTHLKYRKSWLVELLDLPEREPLELARLFGIEGARLLLLRTYEDLYSFKVELPNRSGAYTFSLPANVHQKYSFSFSWNEKKSELNFCFEGRNCHKLRPLIGIPDIARIDWNSHLTIVHATSDVSIANKNKD